ncbi:Carbonic anhydrase [Sphingomonas sp. EC-HK361]|jgi:carbonic anhydrase|uniref:carbonic anhydrase n=1 Tax=Sphingomonas sp. EC-HK361 TaxID=2038397 RepID=UPI00125B4336|nr:carbonic anhydrase [Sphingomonas sp. EC-HK361]VVT03073.1 Carbonic anhydrase [Sphingomonas sp. EC-HK361]
MTDFSDLVDGYHRFRSADYRRQRERWAELKDGQSPKVMVIACSDSRVDPAQIFDTLPGEIFVVRNVAALVPPYETGGGRHGVSAALEFAVTKLKVEEVLVMGHGACGGCAAALSNAFKDAAPGEGGFIADWVSILDEARDKVKASHGDGPDASREMEMEAVRTSIENLETFPFVRSAVDSGALKLRGAYFAIADGNLHVMDDGGVFSPA